MIRFTISPDPIEIPFQQDKLEGVTLKFKTSGFSLAYKLNEVQIEIKGKPGEEPLLKATEKLDRTIPVVPFVTKDIKLDDISLGAIEDFYNEAFYDSLKSETYTLSITVTGTKTSSATATVKFK